MMSLPVCVCVLGEASSKMDGSRISGGEDAHFSE